VFCLPGKGVRGCVCTGKEGWVSPKGRRKRYFVWQVQMFTVKNWLKLGQFPFACKFLKQIPTI
jgi:hypothetical protein